MKKASYTPTKTTALCLALMAVLTSVTLVTFAGETPKEASAMYLASNQSVTIYANTVNNEIVLTGSAPQAFIFMGQVPPQHGSIVDFDENTGVLHYNPAPNYSGDDTLTFVTAAKTNHAWAGDSVGLVTIHVLPPQTDGSAGGNRMHEFGWRIAASLYKMGNVVPDSGMHFYEIGYLNGELYSCMYGAYDAGIGWENLTEGQQVWMVMHFDELAG